MDQLPFFPEEASSIAGSVDLVYFVLLGLASFFTLVVVAAIIYFGTKYRHGSDADRSNPVTTSNTLEIGGMVFLTVLAMGVFVWAAKIYVSYAQVPQTEDKLELFVLGRQWMWEIQHPTGRRELNHLHVPVGRIVELRMTSEDVIHSFYVPAFRIKRDVLPGRYSKAWFQATKVGTYHLFCTEYCGTEHSKMGGTVTVMEPDAYERWLYEGDGDGPILPPSRATIEALPPGRNALAEAGEVLFNRMGCNTCHGANAGVIAPSLQGIYGEEHTMRDGSVVTVDENYLRESILYPSVLVRAGYQAVMPAYQGQLTEQDLLQLIEYIKWLGTAADESGVGAPDQPPQ
jgi:cytochrome c oxidase subunit 2